MEIDGELAVPGLNAAYGSLVGFRRRVNEDAARVIAWSNGAVDGLVCAVADGVGTTPGAAGAARRAVERVTRSFAGSSNPGTLDTRNALRAAVADAHAGIRGVSDGGADEGEATVVAAVLKPDAAHLANVGDSRAYLYADGNLQQVTRDHSWVQEQVRAGSITAEQAMGHPWRSFVTRTVGGAETPVVDIFQRMLVPGSRVLLCSDGLGKVVGHDELAAALEQGGATATVGSLLALARRRKAPDDVTICVIDVGIDRAPHPENSHA